jgi:ABC-type Fe3+-hydroxamate transport system substrate-binding protein
MRSRSHLLIATALVIASCTSSNEPALTTTTTSPMTTTTATTLATSTTSSTTTTVLQPEVSFPEYRIAERIISVETGDTVVLLLDPASYTSLSDLDLYDVIADAVDRFPPIFEAHVVDSQDAVSAVLAEEPDEDQQQTLESHYFARLEDGFRIVYLGPFDGTDDAILGS